MQNLKSISLNKYLTLFICAFIFDVCDIYSQNVEDFFEALPNEYFNNLTKEDRETLLVENVFYPAVNDEYFIQVFRIVESPKNSSNYLKINMSYETGQRGFNTFELKKWNLNTGDYFFWNFKSSRYTC